MPYEGPSAPSPPTREARARRLLVLYNPIAGGRQRQRLEAVLAALTELGCAATVHFTAATGDARRLAAAAHVNSFDAVIAAGGDGTVNEVANGLADSAAAPALGVIPLGTANVFARNLGLPTAPQALARVLAKTPAAAFLPGRVNGRLFVAMAGIGFDARVVAGVDSGLKHRLGKAAYVWQTLVELRRGRACSLAVACNGRRLAAAGVVVLRGRYYGGGFVMAPRAAPERPDFELCCLEGGGLADILRQGLALGLGRFDRLAGLMQLRSSAAEVAGPTDEPIQADGELVGRLPALIDMAPVPLQVVGLSPAAASLAGRGRFADGRDANTA